MADPSSWPGLSPNTKSRTLQINDLQMHVLEALPAGNKSDTKAPLVILLHGFPELAYSWRKVLGPLAEAGYHVVAPDQRGYGRTTNTDSSGCVKYEDDISPFRRTNLVKDIVALVYTLGYETVAAVVGHDSGSPVAAYCALIRPDVFKSVVMMSAPFIGAPKLKIAGPMSTAGLDYEKLAGALAALDPPRKHYTLHNCTPGANAEMTEPPGGLHAFLREYYHMKSADWAPNAPHPLPVGPGGVAGAMEALPHYYIMPLHATMSAAVHEFRPSAEEIQGNKWLTEEELGVYVAEYARTGFQGGLNAYRIRSSGAWSSDCELFDGKRIEVPAMFLGGKQDWGTYQFPGAVEVMKDKACAKMDDFVLIDGAGHWVQQEQGEEVVAQLLRFFRKYGN